MRTWRAMPVLTAMMAAGLLLGPGPGQAQESGTIVISDLPIEEQLRIRTETEARQPEAGELLREARKAEEAGDWSKAARLYERSAGLRADGDHLGAMSFEMAGRAYFFSDRTGRASRMWEEAAGRSLIVGDVIGAARNYMYAAVAVQEKGKTFRATELGWKAYRLSQSEFISDQERNLIRSHIQLAEGSESG